MTLGATKPDKEFLQDAKYFQACNYLELYVMMHPSEGSQRRRTIPAPFIGPVLTIKRNYIIDFRNHSVR